MSNRTKYHEHDDAPTGIVCPKCGHEKTRVLETRKIVHSLARRRACGRCDARFSTAERVVVGKGEN